MVLQVSLLLVYILADGLANEEVGVIDTTSSHDAIPTHEQGWRLLRHPIGVHVHCRVGLSSTTVVVPHKALEGPC